MSSVLSFKTMVHNETGYWGPVDANHQFCEPHYASSKYLAEAWNSISSFVFVFTGLYSLGNVPSTLRSKIWVQTMCLWLTVIGIGSLLFHGTMRRSMQLLDEGPMLGFVTTSIMYKADVHDWTKHNALLFQLLLGAISILILSFYVVLDNYDLFVHSFTVLCVIDTYVAYSICCDRNFVICVGTFLLGRVVWETENRVCADYPFVWPLHVVWHLLSCTASYYAIMIDTNIGLMKKTDNPSKRE